MKGFPHNLKAMELKIVLALLLSAVVIMECRITKDREREGEEIVHSIPESERPDFLAYSLGYGFMEQYRLGSTQKFPFPTLLKIPKKLEEKFQGLETPKNFTSDLYLFVKSTFDLSSADMFSLILRRTVCFPQGRCINLENIGELCCPF